MNTGINFSDSKLTFMSANCIMKTRPLFQATGLYKKSFFLDGLCYSQRIYKFQAWYFISNLCYRQVSIHIMTHN